MPNMPGQFYSRSWDVVHSLACGLQRHCSSGTDIVWKSRHNCDKTTSLTYPFSCNETVINYITELYLVEELVWVWGIYSCNNVSCMRHLIGPLIFVVCHGIFSCGTLGWLSPFCHRIIWRCSVFLEHRLLKAEGCKDKRGDEDIGG